MPATIVDVHPIEDVVDPTDSTKVTGYKMKLTIKQGSDKTLIKNKLQELFKNNTEITGGNNNNNQNGGVRKSKKSKKSAKKSAKKSLRRRR